MRYYSTKQQTPNQSNSLVSVRDAVLKGLAPDGGLYMPETLPSLPKGFLESKEQRDFHEIAYNVAVPFLLPDVSPQQVQNIVESAFDFPIPLSPIGKSCHILELFHGPTLAFKDFGARFMARLMSYLTRHSDEKLTILVATSGDTGSAVAHGFFEVQGVDVVLLYPSGKVSNMQEKQFTTLGSNIQALEVEGTFDDCQRLVKTAFLDSELKRKFNLASANSINIARLIPQSFYYIYAANQLREQNQLVFSVPSGNFGNLTAGLFAKKIGLDSVQFVASTNANSTVPDYLNGEDYKERPSVQTLSNAMDVGAPSNFARIQALYQNNREAIKKDIWGTSVSDDETLEEINKVYSENNYTLDPHGAVALIGLNRFLKSQPNYHGIALETAHPAKFHEVMEKAQITEIPIPEKLKATLDKEKQSIKIPNSFSALKEYLM